MNKVSKEELSKDKFLTHLAKDIIKKIMKTSKIYV